MWLLAIMQVESGGELDDLMQSSGSLELPADSLQQEASIRQGCSYFAQLLRRAESEGCDLDTTIQAYNYGSGFIDYVAEHGGKYSLELSEKFAEKQSGGATVPYDNLLAVKRNGGWRYCLRQYVLRKARQSAFGAVIEKRQDSPRAALCGGRRGLLSFFVRLFRCGGFFRKNLMSDDEIADHMRDYGQNPRNRVGNVERGQRVVHPEYREDPDDAEHARADHGHEHRHDRIAEAAHDAEPTSIMPHRK